MKIMSRRKWVNIMALGLAGLGTGYLGKNYVVPEILGRTGNSPNIVLISIDTLRADYFTPEHMPETWEWVADNCLYFTNAHANSTWTLPSHLTMLTGLLPHEHQVELAVDLIPDDLEMIQCKLERRGYKTIAFTGGGFVGSEFGFSRGFSEWHEDSSEIGSFVEAKKYLSSLSSNRFDKPKFIFLHTFYTNYKFDEDPPGKYGEFHPDKYDKRIRDFDGKLVDMISSILESSISDNLRMIITSDHGEGFGEIYNLYDREFISEYHGDWPCPSQVRIPLLVYDSQNTVKGSWDKLVGLDNLSPTIQVWAGTIDSHEMYLLDKEEERDFILSESIPLVGLERAIRKGEDMSKRGVAKIDKRGEYIETWAAKRFGEDKEKVPGRELSDAKKKELEALGYLIP